VQQNGPQDDAVANLRAQWEAQYASLEMPPPPPNMYATREELIASAKEWAERNGYTLVIGHSSKHQGQPSRCWLTCDLGGVYRNRHHLTPEMRKRKRESRKLDCPMRVLGTKRKYEEGWLLHLPDPSKAAHNHGAIARTESPIGPSEFPDLEQALYEWHQQCVADGIAVHGNTLKAKAIELYKSMPIYRDRGPLPELGNGWLNDYRRRMGLPIRPTKQNSTVPASRPSAASHYVNMEDSLPIHPSNRELFKATKSYVKVYMSRFDASHDYNHVLRVLALSNRILALETAAFPSSQYDESAVFLGALLHDVGDSKYAEPGQDTENQIAEILLERGATDTLALKVQMIAKNVSYTNEVKNPRLVRAILTKHPELAIVQDADRLDAIGAIGIGRAFTFGGAKRLQEGMQGTIKHFSEKLEKLETMMKVRHNSRF
jgi:HD superfamily phosphodiesterase